MKKRKFILGIVSIMTLCLTACGKPNMTFEETIDSITNSEISKMMNNAEIYEQNFEISSNFSTKKDNVDAKISFSTNSKQNLKDSEGETKITLKVNASWDGDEWRETISINWDAIIKYLSNAIYFKLNSLDIDWPEDFAAKEFSPRLESIKDQRFSFELTDEILNAMKEKLPEDFDLNKIQNKENLEKFEKNLQEFKDNLKKAINNEWSLVYNWIYSEFHGSNARKFSIDKEKVFNATSEYIKTLIPEEYMDDYTKSIEEADINEVFEDFPLKNFEWYLVITWKKKVQIVIENLDIENYSSNTKLIGTFGTDKYELTAKNDGEDLFIFSAKLNNTHYDISMKINDSEILKWTVSPKISHWKLNVDFDLSINLGFDEKINIPLKGKRKREEISKFNVETPANSKNLLKDIMKDMDEIDPSTYQLLTEWIDNKQTIEAPVIAGGVLASALVPRMKSAQDRARDVSRKASLSQLQSAIVTYQWDKWMRPGMNAATKWISVSKIKDELLYAWMSSIPTDPEWNNKVSWLWALKTVDWGYSYLVTKRNWSQNGWFVLMAKTEVEWWSNWVVCENKSWLENWYITNDTDLKDINPCAGITKWDSCSAKNCTYTNRDELRYILIY